MKTPRKIEYWLVELSRYGCASRLADGPHDTRAGVEKAMYLFGHIDSIAKLNQGKTFACARVELTPVKGSSRGVNHRAVEILNHRPEASQ